MREPFPFWSVTFAVALGVLIASAVQWLFAATMAGMLLSQLEVPEPVATSRPVQAPARGPDPLPDPRPPYCQPARASVPTGEKACMAGRVVTRQANGWTEAVGPTGKNEACRDYR